MLFFYIKNYIRLGLVYKTECSDYEIANKEPKFMWCAVVMSVKVLSLAVKGTNGSLLQRRVLRFRKLAKVVNG